MLKLYSQSLAVFGLLVLLASPLNVEARVFNRGFSNMRGGVFNTQGSQMRTGQGVFARGGTYNGITAGDRRYGGSFSGTGTRSFQEGQGYTRSYQGAVNTNRGTYDISRTTNYGRNSEGGLSKTQTRTITGPNGGMRSLSTSR